MEANKKLAQPKDNPITFKEKTFTNPVKHKTHKANRHREMKTLKLQTTKITLTTTQFQEAIKQSKNNNFTGPDKVNIRHLKHI